MERPRLRFCYRLAAHLGIMDVDGMRAAMTPDELDKWMAFDLVEPIGPRGGWVQIASVLQWLAAKAGVEISLDENIPGLKLETDDA